MTDLTKFKHKTTARVRSYHIDPQFVVHNAWYLFFLEDGRMEYFRSLGVSVEREAFTTKTKIQVVQNTITYRNPAHFDEVLEIYTRIAFVKNSSIGIEQVILERESKRLIAEATGIIVHLHPETNVPTRVSDEIRQRIMEFDGGDVEFQNGK